MRKILLLMALLVPFNLLSPSMTEQKDFDKTIHDFYMYKNYDNLYGETINSIKSFEGLMLKKYYCPAGYSTIGYGHLIKKGESFPDSISIERANDILNKDFEIAINEVVRLTKYNRYSDANKVLALAHFTFNVGSLSLQRSQLLKLSMMNKQVSYEFMRWVNYRDKDSTVIKSNHLVNMRKYEVKVYNMEVKIY